MKKYWIERHQQKYLGDLLWNKFEQGWISENLFPLRILLFYIYYTDIKTKKKKKLLIKVYTYSRGILISHWKDIPSTIHSFVGGQWKRRTSLNIKCYFSFLSEMSRCSVVRDGRNECTVSSASYSPRSLSAVGAFQNTEWIVEWIFKYNLRTGFQM